MARASKADAGGQLPRNGADAKTVEGVAHDHGDGDKNHLHRLGDLPHLHSEDGKAVLLDEHGKPLFTDDGTEVRDGASYGSVPGQGYVEPRDPATAEEDGAEWAKAEARREELREDATTTRRAEIAASVTSEDRAEMEAIRSSHPDILNGSQPRPAAVAGPPGSRLADVSSRASTWTLLGFPVEVQDELVWAEIAKNNLDAMIEDVVRTRRPSDPALVAAALDAVLHVAKARGLA